MSPHTKQGWRSKSWVAGGASAAILIAVASTTAQAAPTPAPKASAAAASTASCPATPGIDGKTVKLGIIYPATGAAAPTFVAFNRAVQLRVDQENAKGGVNGRKIVTTTYDDAGSGATQTTVATKAVEQDQMFGLTVATSAVTMYPYLAQQNIPVVGMRTSAEYGTYRNMFGATGAGTNDFDSAYYAQRLKDAGVTNAASISHNTAGGIASANSVYATFPSVGLKQGLKITDLPQGAYDATSTALRLKQAGVDGVYEVVFADGGVSIANAIKQQGVTGIKAQMFTLSDPKAVQQAASALEGVIASTYGAVPVTAPVPAMRTFLHGMLAAGANPYGAAAPVGYIVADEFIRGLKMAGTCPTRANFIDKLRTLTNYNAGGMLPERIQYTPGLTPNGNPPRCMWFSVVKNGVLVPDAKTTCGPIVSRATGAVVLPAP